MSTSNPETFVCDLCGGEFEDKISPAKAEVEYMQTFTPAEREGGRAKVCDACYERTVRFVEERRGKG